MVFVSCVQSVRRSVAHTYRGAQRRHSLRGEGVLGMLGSGSSCGLTNNWISLRCFVFNRIDSLPHYGFRNGEEERLKIG